MLKPLFYTCLLYLVTSLAFPAVAQNSRKAPATKNTTAKPAPKEIAWKADRKLNWDDFIGKADPKTDKYALTTCDLNVSFACDGDKLTFKADAVFIPSESWTRSLDSDRLLAHEQLHFDITELHARMLRKTLSVMPQACKLTQEEVQKIINTAFQNWQQMEEDYDKATRHGLNHEEQANWQQTIKASIEALNGV